MNTEFTTKNDIESQMRALTMQFSAGIISQDALAHELSKLVETIKTIQPVVAKFLAKKMQWLIDICMTNVDTRTRIVQNVNKKMEEMKYGVVRAATGVGKSGIIYKDIVHNIKSSTKKQVFIISTPLLVLNDQFFTDLMEVLFGLGLSNNQNTIVINNSSDDEKKKGTVVLEDSQGKLHDTGIQKADQSGFAEMKPITIVNTTHKSFNGLIAELSVLKPEEWEIHVYVDESHTAKVC